MPQGIDSAQTARFAEFFLHSTTDVVRLELLEISHPNTSTYRIVRNASRGVTVVLEDGTSARFDYYPLKIEWEQTLDNLDFAISVQLGDLGEIIPGMLDAIRAANGGSFHVVDPATGARVRPTVKFRIYRSDDVTAPIFGPVTLQADSLAMKREGAAFTASAPSLNLARTGEIYTFERFPGLVGVL